MHVDFAYGNSMIHALDARARILAAVALAAVLAVADRLPALAFGLIAGAFLAALAELNLRPLLRRLLIVNIFIAMLWVLLPLGGREEIVAALGPFAFHRDGLWLALAVTLKSNAIVLVTIALLGTIDVATMGHALHHLKAPSKLIHLFLFTVRYFDVLKHEYERLRNAMRIRGFTPRLDRRTCRTFGYLVGMLLVNSLDRSERVMKAMKCRGFTGRFYVFRHMACTRHDVMLAGGVLLLLCTIGWLEWIVPL